MRLFLASSLDKSATLLPEKLSALRNKTVLFIANAADNHEGDKWWVRLDKEAFEKMGYKVLETDLRNISKADLTGQIKKTGIIHFCGGSVLYLILLIRENNLSQIIVDSVKNGEIIYSGTSAGSMIVAKDLSLSAFDPEEEQLVKKMGDYSGLGLADFLIMPHANNDGFLEGNKRMIEQLPKYNQPLIFIYDNQVVWVEDDKMEILTAK